MNSRLPRLGAAALGLAVLVAARGWTASGLESSPLHAYGMEWFLKLGPGEGAFFLRYALLGTLGTVLLAWGLAPIIAAPVRRHDLGRALLPTAVVLAAVLLSVARFGVLDREVVTDDERVYRFQAELLADGKAALPAPELAEFHTNVFVDTVGGRWLGQYPPGHPLVLAPFEAMGLADVVPVLLGVLGVLCAGLLFRMLAGTGVGGVGALLLAVSPLFVLTGATLLSHSTSFLAFTLSLYGAVRHVRHGRAWSALLCGAAWGLLFLARPYTAVTLGLVAPALLLTHALRFRSWKGVGLALLPAALSGIGFLAYNAAATGSAWTTGYDALRRSGAIEFGFGTIVAGYHDHTPLQGFKNAGILGLRYLFWIAGAPVLVLAGAWAFRDRKLRPSVRVAWACLAVGLVSYVPYWAIGVNDTGPVKMFELLLPGVFLVAVGLVRLGRERTEGWPAGLMVAGATAAAMVFWPPQVGHLRDIVRYVREPLDLVQNQVELPALVFVQNVQPPEGRCWVYGRPIPKPDLSDPILYVRDLGPRNLAFWRLHENRHPYRLEYRDNGFVVLPLRVMQR